jgi:hypothetical protein
MKIYCQSGKLAVEIEAGCVFLNRCPGMIYYPAEESLHLPDRDRGECGGCSAPGPDTEIERELFRSALVCGRV